MTRKERQRKIRESFKRSMDTIMEREGQYGAGPLTVGGALASIFPEGVTLRTPEDFARFFYLTMVQMKLSRYANAFHEGSPDSSHDGANYFKLLELFDEFLREVENDEG